MPRRSKTIFHIGTQAQVDDPAYEGAMVVDSSRDGQTVFIKESKLGAHIKFPIALLDDVIEALTALKSPRP